MRKWMKWAVVGTLLGAALWPAAAEAISNEIAIKGEGVKSKALLLDGTWYTKPEVLEAGERWKVISEKNHLWVMSRIDQAESPQIEIPQKEIEGQAYVDFSYFAKPAGLDYVYNEKKKQLKIQRSREENHMSLPKPLVVMWDPEQSFDAEKPFFSEKMGQRVISPTWGSYEELRNANRVPSFSYLKQAKEAGVAVMPLVHNDFNLEETAKFVRDKKGMSQWIQQMVALANVYDLAGYNIDFEKMNQKDAPLFTDFIREFSIPLHEKGKLLTVDITVYNEGSPIWSLCYDRKSLADWADYQIIMGYDETPRGSQKPGSVSSYNWLDRSIQRLLQDVPAEKLILGLPFYTRVWKGNPGALSSSVLTIKNTETYKKQHPFRQVWLKQERQPMASWKEKGVRHQVWLEDADSLYEKMQLGKSYGLAGYAFWRYGFETPTWYEELESRLEGKTPAVPLAPVFPKVQPQGKVEIGTSPGAALQNFALQGL